MSDAVFKTQVAAPASTPTPQGVTPTQDGSSKVEVPYLDYSVEHGTPYLVDYFGLGEHWAELQGGFPKEIEAIDDYIGAKIKAGEIPNDTKSIKDYISKIEKLVNIKNEPRAVIRVETVADYIKFLKSTDDRRTNLRRLYG